MASTSRHGGKRVLSFSLLLGWNHRFMPQRGETMNSAGAVTEAYCGLNSLSNVIRSCAHTRARRPHLSPTSLRSRQVNSTPQTFPVDSFDTEWCLTTLYYFIPEQCAILIILLAIPTLRSSHWQCLIYFSTRHFKIPAWSPFDCCCCCFYFFSCLLYMLGLLSFFLFFWSFFSFFLTSTCQETTVGN